MDTTGKTADEVARARELTIRGQLGVNTRWGNDEAARENRRALNAIKAEKLMRQAYGLLHEDSA